MFFPMAKMPNRSDVQSQIDKVYPGAKLISYSADDYVQEIPSFMPKEQHGLRKKERIKSGGLNEKGRKVI